MSVANKVKERRLQLGMSQAALAKLSGVSQNTIFKIENSKIKDSGKIHKVALALGLSVDGLVFDENLPPATVSPEKSRLLRKIDEADDKSLDQIEEAIDAILKLQKIKSGSSD